MTNPYFWLKFESSSHSYVDTPESRWLDWIRLSFIHTGLVDLTTEDGLYVTSVADMLC